MNLPDCLPARFGMEIDERSVVTMPRDQYKRFNDRLRETMAELDRRGYRILQWGDPAETLVSSRRGASRS
jgi:hypothetical protein